MLYKLLFIIQVTVKAVLKYCTSTKQSTSVTKVGIAFTYQAFIDAGFQVTVQINDVLLYNKKQAN